MVVQTNDWFSMLSYLDVYLGTGVTLLEHTYCFYKTSHLQKFKIVVNITKEKSFCFLPVLLSRTVKFVTYKIVAIIALFVARPLHVQELCSSQPHT